jgi:ABC-type branched-subunit amino acid transport system permease subunit
MQTYLVHTRRPFVLQRELGFARTLGFHLYLGGLILSALVHPLFYLAIAADAVLDIGPASFGATFGPALWWLSVCNLVAGYLAAIVIGAVSARRRGHCFHIAALLMPIYWMLISLAAYRALWQLYSDPYLWEKTPHGLAEDDG